MAPLRCTLVAASVACSFAAGSPAGNLDACERSEEGHLDQVSLLQTENRRYHRAQARVRSEFMPSEDFQGSALVGGRQQGQAAHVQAARGSHEQRMPYGVSSPPQANWNPAMGEYGNFPLMDVPKDMPYSLDGGNTIRSYSLAKQDTKILTQLLPNITNGFYIDSNAGDGEHGSNTLLFELLGWRGVLTEPRTYWYLNLWSKFRKAWLFMGSISPNAEHVQLGFDMNGQINMASGHRVHAHPLPSFLAEIGNRKTVDFWSVDTGGYEPEVLNTTLNSGYGIEVGVVCVTLHDHVGGAGNETWELRTRLQAEQLLSEIMQKASFTYVGGLNPVWVNTLIGRYEYRDAVFVNPSYYSSRGLPVPTQIKSAPPISTEEEEAQQLSLLQTDNAEWDEGYTHEEEVTILVDYIQRSRESAVVDEPVPKAHRGEETALPGSSDVWVDPRTMIPAPRL
jgi:hypothetical protein